MLILVGLGNPGPQYARNRHNIGFMAVDAIHEAHHFGPWRRRFQAEVAEGTLAGRRVLLMKPTTFMNESGRAVGEAARFFKVPPEAIVVLHDDLDLPAAKLRMKAGGGHGGHNGVRSIIAHIGENFRRARLGIGHPGAKERVRGHVLHDFAKADAEWLDPLIGAIAAHAPLLAEDKDSTFANRVTLATRPEKAGRGGPAGGHAETARTAASPERAGRGPDPAQAGPAAARAASAPGRAEGALAAAFRKLLGHKP